MTLFTRFILLAAGAACLPSAAYAELLNSVRIEEPTCQPITTANEALAKIPIFQTTWDLVSKSDKRVVMHIDSIYSDGTLYQRTAPYASWHGKPDDLVNPRHSGCHRLREEVLDGVNTVVISYWKHNPDFDPRWYRCNIWLRIPEYRNEKMDCSSVYFSEAVEIKVRWFYRTDIKLPVTRPE
ncbi:hypothetical protein [Mesorhizobium sp. M0768]|uniref:hypothetical protein n=1 Tax=Mesorhizobium sp. M0768 TaxID=2956996 RepID=UPI003339296D